MSQSDHLSPLQADNVDEIFRDCLFREGEDTSTHVAIEGITMKVGLHPERLASHEEEIGAMLAELPDDFYKAKGGGMSFLNACNDRNGRLWTGVHRTMELLFLLGMGVKKAEFLVPRELWGTLPGGMPYIVIDV